MQLCRQPISILICALLLLFMGNAVRYHLGERHVRRAAATVHAGGSAAAVMDRADRSRGWVSEDARPHLIRGQSAYAMALRDEATGETWLQMAAVDLTHALRRNPLDATAFRTLALTAKRLGATQEAIGFAQAAIERAPSNASNQWVLARLLPAASGEQAEAYRRVTALRPDLTRAVLADVAAYRLSLAASSAYVAPHADAYLAWAEAVTADTERNWIAAEGLRLLPVAGTSPRTEAWLSYYVALGQRHVHPAAALEMLARAVQLWPREQAFHRNHGFALLEVGRPEDAKAAFRKSVALFSDLANAAHLGLAKADESLGHTEAALGLYQRLAHNQRLEEWVRREARNGLARIERLQRM